MSAKHKLNAANWVGAVLVAGLIGGAAGSWAVFLVAVAVLLASGWQSGDIRR